MQIRFSNGITEELKQQTACHISVADLAGITVDPGMQCVLYVKEGFHGRSYFINGSTHEGEVTPAEICLDTIRSIRLFETTYTPEQLNPETRDMGAIAEAAATWWQEDLPHHDERIAWWREARFGCFIHWGVYALAGGFYKGKACGYAEHIERALAIPVDEYQTEFIDKFNPVNFDADEWVRIAKEAGMEYFVITAKHHDGFCIYPSDAYPYDIRMTPFGDRDPLRELKEACKKYNMRYGFYYSHAYDWEHADAPGNDWDYENFGGTRFLFDPNRNNTWYVSHPEMLERVARHYVDEKSIPQIVELIKNYEPDILWFDTPHKLPISENLRILKAIRDTDPRVVVNGRLARSGPFPSFGDYINTSDRPAEIFPANGDWEAIPTTNESYGYNGTDHSHKPASHFIRLAAKTVARGGNMLMNIGPMGDGRYDPVDVEILRGIGEWFSKNGESIHGCTRNPLAKPSWGEITRKGQTLYLHVFESPADGKVLLAGMLNHVKEAYVLEDDQKTPLTVTRRAYYDTELVLPEAYRHDNVVIAVTVAGEIFPVGGRLLANDRPDTLLTFDADVIPTGLGHGDGKTNRNFVGGFKHPEQALVWHLRSLAKTAYTATVRYMRRGEDDGGRYRLAIGGESIERAILTDKVGERNIITDTFDLTVPGGIHDLTLAPTAIEGGFAHFFDITLTPKAGSAAAEEELDRTEEEIDLGDAPQAKKG